MFLAWHWAPGSTFKMGRVIIGEKCFLNRANVHCTTYNIHCITLYSAGSAFYNLQYTPYTYIQYSKL